MTSQEHPRVAEIDGIIDTSVVIALQDQDPATLPIFPGISAVTLAELSVGPLATTDPEEQVVRQSRLQLCEARFDPIPFDADAARAFGRVAAALRSMGRKHSARAYDALIAATALARGLPLYTLNAREFEGIPGLQVHTPRSPRTTPPA